MNRADFIVGAIAAVIAVLFPWASREEAGPPELWIDYHFRHADGETRVWVDGTESTAFFEDDFETGNLSKAGGGFSWGSHGGNVNVETGAGLLAGG